MIHPLTLVTFAAFLGAGLYVFQTKEEVSRLDRELRDVTRQIEGERSRTQTLSAEWARLNDQDRLRNMATTYLSHMQPMEPAQFQRLDDAQRRMPQVLAFAPEATGFRRRADAPSAPGEVLVFTATTMLAEAEPRRAAPAQRIAPEPSAVVSEAPAAAAPVTAAPAPAPVIATPRPVPQPVPVVATAPAPRTPVAPRPEVAALPPIAGPAVTPASRVAEAPAAAHAPRSVTETATASRASALPPIAGPAVAPTARVAEAPAARSAEPASARVADATPAARPAPRIRARAEAPQPRASQLAQAPVSAPPAALRTAMHVQPAPVAGGSLLGGGSSLPPPVPFGR